MVEQPPLGRGGNSAYVVLTSKVVMTPRIAAGLACLRIYPLTVIDRTLGLLLTNELLEQAVAQ